MSATICWREVPTKPPPRFDGTSSMWNRLCMAFNAEPSLPIVLGQKDVHILEAMACADPTNGFYEQIAHTIKNRGDIEVWCDY